MLNYPKYHAEAMLFFLCTTAKIPQWKLYFLPKSVSYLAEILLVLSNSFENISQVVYKYWKYFALRIEIRFQTNNGLSW